VIYNKHHCCFYKVAILQFRQKKIIAFHRRNTKQTRSLFCLDYEREGEKMNERGLL